MKIYGPHKRRTHQHVIADLGVHHVVGVILEEGHTAERFGYDYGYDQLMVTYDHDGYLEPGAIRLQIKASENLRPVHGGFVYDLDVRDINLWLADRSIVLLVLFDALRKRAYWLDVQEYFRVDPARKPIRGSKRMRVRVPIRQRWTRKAVALQRQKKLGLFVRLREEP
jgi:hypothetical protein